MGADSSGPVSSVAWVRGVDVSLEMLERDPYPAFASLQEREPVAFVPSLDMWLVTRWDDVVYVCEHPELFGSNTEPSWLRELVSFALGRNLRVVGGGVRLILPPGASDLPVAVRGIFSETPHMLGPAACRGLEFPGAGNVLIQRSVFDEVGTFDQSLAEAGESVLVFRVED